MTATVVAVAIASSSPPSIQITIAGVATATATVQRTDPTGAQYGVRGGEPITLVAGAGVLIDYEMPYNQLVTYSVIDSTGVVVASAQAQVTVAQSWLVRPAFPGLSIPLYNVVLGGDVLPTGVVRYVIPGRRTAISVGDGQRKAPSSTFGFRTVDDAAASSAISCLSGSDTLLLQVVFVEAGASSDDPGFGEGPFGEGPFGGTGVGAAATCLWRYVSLDEVDEDRLTGVFSDQRRKFSVAYTVDDRPDGSVQSEWTYADVAADYTSYQDVLNKYLTYTGLTTGAEGT